ncbi:MAG: toll/interleukin-1 receptor domain-containing protein [Gemmatimonadales bacterium]
MAFSVFISYSTKDLVHAAALQSWVASAGAQTYLAEYSLAPGRPIAAEILTAIKASDLFLLLWSANARDSEWVPQEIGVARGAEKAIIPIVLHQGLELPGFIKDLKYVEVYRDPMASVQWLRNHVGALVRKKNSDALIGMGVIGAILLLLANARE